MVVVVHRSARDKYQAAQALEEAGLLQCLVTDFYWPNQARWANAVKRLASARIATILAGRQNSAVPYGKSRMCAWSGLSSVALSRLPGLPFSWRARSMRWSDHCLGREAGRIASNTGSTLLSYSYYGYSAFCASDPSVPKILFQLHPHPASVRSILRAELERYPECANSLNKEWELALPEEDYSRMVAETSMAQRWIVASSFTRETLIQHGIEGRHIRVIPYGIDVNDFSYDQRMRNERSCNRPLEVLFVGRLNQRKGIRYLLEALDRVNSPQLHLTVCGWAVDDLALLSRYAHRITIKPSATEGEIKRAYQQADIFVLPSVAEGFGYVLLEAMASGVPVVSTTRTAAPDLIRNGQEGFVVEPSCVDALATALDWALSHREQVRAMGTAARKRACQFSWGTFRGSLAGSVQLLTDEILQDRNPKVETHV